MKIQSLILALVISAFGNLALAESPSLNLTNINSPESISMTLKIQNTKNVSNVKFTGLDNFQVLGREISINNSSENESNNLFSSTLILAPIKAESSVVYATALVDGKQISSNKLSFNITPKQLADFKDKQKKQALIQKENMEKNQKLINQQLVAQQKYFNDMNKIMQQQQSEMLKAQQELFKQMDSNF